MLNPHVMTELLSGDSFAENMADIQAEIARLEPLIEAEGGIKAIAQKEREIASKTELADTALKHARTEADKTLQAANERAAEILSSAQIRAEQLTVQAQQELKVINQAKEDLKKQKVEANKAQSSIQNAEKELEKREQQLQTREAEVSRKEVILSQL